MEPSSAGPQGRLFVSPSGVAFLGRGLSNEPHKHFTASITLALEGTLRVRSDEGHEWQDVYGIAALPNASQQLLESDAQLVNLQVDPETEAYARLAARLWVDQELVLFRERELGGLRAALHSAAISSSPGVALWTATLDALGGPATGPRTFDPRIAQVLATLKGAMPDAPTAQELGDKVGLSEGRLIHLFSEQVGVPLRRYVLWLRIRHIVFCLAVGKNLTDAAHEAGFADSAHLTRVFRSMFGLAPSQILRSDGVTISLEIPSLPLTGPHAVQDMERLRIMMAKLAAGSKWPPIP
ncbi:MAG: AraC family transcriptional regulator [Myxococcales bacterium]